MGAGWLSRQGERRGVGNAQAEAEAEAVAESWVRLGDDDTHTHRETQQ